MTALADAVPPVRAVVAARETVGAPRIAANQPVRPAAFSYSVHPFTRPSCPRVPIHHSPGGRHSTVPLPPPSRLGMGGVRHLGVATCHRTVNLGDRCLSGHPVGVSLINAHVPRQRDTQGATDRHFDGTPVGLLRLSKSPTERPSRVGFSYWIVAWYQSRSPIIDFRGGTFLLSCHARVRRSQGSCDPVKVTLPELRIEGGILST